MTHRTRSFALAAAVLGTLAVTGLSRAATAEPTPEELLERAQKLIEQAEPQKAARAESAEADKAAALDRVLADAEARSTKPAVAAGTPVLLQNGDIDDPDPFTAGHNGKFLLQSEDGNFSLNPNFQLQVRHVANFAPIDENGGEGDAFDDLDFGFEIRRAKIGFKGNAFSPDLTYDIRLNVSRNGGQAILDNAFVDYTPENGLFNNDALGLRIGQYKDPTFYEEASSSSRQMAADRSLVNETLGGGVTDYVQGVGIIYKGDKANAFFSYVDGVNSGNTNYEDGLDLLAGLTGRVDVIVKGDEGAFRDFTALGTDEDSARVGAGAFLQIADDGDDVGYALLHTIDASYETSTGLGLFAAYYGTLFDDGGTGGSDGYNAGAEAQISQVLDEENGWEVFGRYDFIVFDEDVDGEDFYHELVAGVNKYWESHKVKMTVDVGILPNGNPGGNSGIGYRADGASDEMQLTIRGQFQLLL